MHTTIQPQVSVACDIVGNLKNYQQEWRNITSDKWVQDAVSNCHVEFETQPCQASIPKELNFSEKEKTIISSEIQDLLTKGTIEEAQHC